MLSDQLEQQLADLLRANVAFSILDDELIHQLVGNCQMETFTLGQTVVTEGDQADSAYVVYSGRLRVFRKGETGRPVTLNTLTAGDFFGEAALLNEGSRTASVRASEDVVLFRLDRAEFQSLLDNNPEIRSYFEIYMRERSVVNFLQLATFLGSLKPREVLDLLAQLHPRDFAADEKIIQQGDPGDEMYIIRSGEVKVVIESNGSEKLIRNLGEGDYFGERALILSEPRSASVIATEDSKCFTLSRADFDRLLESSPNIREQLSERLQQYHVDEELREKYGLDTARPVEKRKLDFQEASASAPPVAAQPAATPRAKRKQRLRKRGIGKYPAIRQQDERDCGAASLAMIARYYGIRLPVGRLRDICNVGREGASLFSLARGAEKVGFTTRAIRTEYDHLRNVKMPCIAHWKGYHYIVVYKVTKKRVILADPGYGLIKMPRKEFEAGWTGRILELNPTVRLEEHEAEKTTMGRFLPLLRPFRWLLLEIFLASLVLQLLQLASPIFTQVIVDKVLVHRNVKMLNIMLGGMIIIGVFQLLSSLLRQYLVIHVSQKLKLRMSSDLFRRIMLLPMRFFQTRQMGDIMQRFTDNERVQRMMTGQAITTVLNVVMMFTALALMLYYNAKLTLVALVTVPAYVILTLAFTPFIKRWRHKEFEARAETSSGLIESVDCIETVKSATAEQNSQWEHEDHIIKTANIQFRVLKLQMWLQACSGSLQIFASTFLLWYGAHLVIDGELTVGQLMAFMALIGQVTAPIMSLIGLWDQIQDMLMSLRRLNDIHEAEPEQDPQADAVILPRLRGTIKFENMSFRYNEDDKDVLSNFNLEIEAGQTCAVVGRSGSGKTTIIRLLQRFHQPTEGRILIDGFDLASGDVRSLRDQVGVVSQDGSILSGTIRENIAVSDPEASMDRIVAAARLADAHGFITAFPMGYDTVIGRLGIQLSGGQRQRVWIARALLKDPRVLIFDEATSALDTESEKAIQQNMEAVLHDRTAIVIAHRLSTVQNADTIIVLDEGQIVEKGTHRELLDEKGLYYYLCSQQLTL